GGMYEGDKSRKTVLVEHGLRLPSRLHNRPLKFHGRGGLVPHRVYVSPWPAKFEFMQWGGVTAEQVSRPTGLLDPEIVVKPLKGQVDDLMEQARPRVGMGGRGVGTTLTKPT